MFPCWFSRDSITTGNTFFPEGSIKWNKYIYIYTCNIHIYIAREGDPCVLFVRCENLAEFAKQGFLLATSMTFLSPFVWRDMDTRSPRCAEGYGVGLGHGAKMDLIP